MQDGSKNAVVVLAIAALVLLTACGLSLWSGKTIGLYGVTQPRTSLIYWIIVVTYGGLGGLCVLFALKLVLR